MSVQLSAVRPEGCGVDSMKHTQGEVPLAQRVRAARVAIETGDHAPPTTLQLSATEAFLGHAFKGKATKYEHDGPYLECALSGRFRLLWLLVGLAFGPGLTLILIFGDINPATPTFFRVVIACLSGVMWVFLGRMLRFDRRVFFDFESGQVIFAHRVFRQEYFVVNLDQIVGIDKIKIIRARQEHKSGNTQAYLDGLRESAKIACYCLVLSLKDGQQLNVLETTDEQMVQDVMKILEEKRVLLKR